MHFDVDQGNIAEQSVDCLVVNLFEGVTTPGGATGAVDRALDGAISQLIAGGDFDGKAETTALLYTNGKLPAPRVLVVGLGDAAQFDLHGVRKAAAVAAEAAEKLAGVSSIATIVHGAGIGGLDVADATQALVEGTALAIYKPPQYKREPDESTLVACTIVEFDADKLARDRRWCCSRRSHRLGRLPCPRLCQRAGQRALPRRVCPTRPGDGRGDWATSAPCWAKTPCASWGWASIWP